MNSYVGSKKLIMETRFGSHLYGTATPESDQDFRGVFLPPKEEILLGDYPHTLDFKTKEGSGKNTKEDVDRQYFSLKKFLNLLQIGDTGAYDMLFAPQEGLTCCSEEWLKIISLRHLLVQKNLDGMVRYVYCQGARYGLKGSNIDALDKVIEVLVNLPSEDKSLLHWEAIKSGITGLSQVSWLTLPINDKKVAEIRAFEILKRKFPATNHVRENLRVARCIRASYGNRAEMARESKGIDWKAIYHAYRVLGQTEELLTTGHITFPRPDAEKLLQIRRQEIPYSVLSEEIVERIEGLKVIKEKSTLPDKLNDKFVDGLIIQMHEEICLNT